MLISDHYDAIIIGAGQAGSPLALAFSAAGRKVALIERNYVGGTCINVGCTPTKTMIASARVAYLTRRGAEYGVHLAEVQVNMREVRDRKRAVVESFRASSERRQDRAENVDLIIGEAQFVGPKTVEVKPREGGTCQMSAEIICIDTGMRPALPPIEGLDRVPVLDSTSIMELDDLPDHLIVLGGGYIGVEFSQMFCRFGSPVTIIERGSQLMGREDADVARAIADIFRDDGITVLLNSAVSRVEQVDGRIVVTFADGKTISGSHLLAALGRKPNTEDLNLSAAGIEVDGRGFIPVNERLETNVPGVYALGDVNGGPAFTHISYDDYRILKANLLDGGNRTTHNRMVPYCAYIDPELGRVGLTETQAREQGYNVRVAKIPMDYISRAVEARETRGFIKAVVDGDTDQILGCAVLGLNGGEIMSAISIAMMGNLPYTVLRDAVFAHPTLMEGLNTLFSSFVDGR